MAKGKKLAIKKPDKGKKVEEEDVEEVEEVFSAKDAPRTANSRITEIETHLQCSGEANVLPRKEGLSPQRKFDGSIPQEGKTPFSSKEVLELCDTIKKEVVLVKETISSEKFSLLFEDIRTMKQDLKEVKDLLTSASRIPIEENCSREKRGKRSDQGKGRTFESANEENGKIHFFRCLQKVRECKKGAFAVEWDKLMGIKESFQPNFKDNEEYTALLTLVFLLLGRVARSEITLSEWSKDPFRLRDFTRTTLLVMEKISQGGKMPPDDIGTLFDAASKVMSSGIQKGFSEVGKHFMKEKNEPKEESTPKFTTFFYLKYFVLPKECSRGVRLSHVAKPLFPDTLQHLRRNLGIGESWVARGSSTWSIVSSLPAVHDNSKEMENIVRKCAQIIFENPTKKGNPRRTKRRRNETETNQSTMSTSEDEDNEEEEESLRRAKLF